MPCLTITHSPQGPCVDLVVTVSKPRFHALLTAGRMPPHPISVRGLLDTGASSTVLDTGIIKKLGLNPTGSISCHTPSTQDGVPYQMRQYDVGLGLFHPEAGNHGALVLNPISVLESSLAHQGIQALIGRDILHSCLFVFNGSHFSIAF